MANKNPKQENLIPNSERTPKELKEMTSNGGKKSGESRREKKKLKETLQALMELNNSEGKTNQEALCLALLEKALKGDVQAFTAIRDSMGEKPTDKIITTENKPLTPEQRKQISKDFGFE